MKARVAFLLGCIMLAIAIGVGVVFALWELWQRSPNAVLVCLWIGVGIGLMVYGETHR